MAIGNQKPKSTRPEKSTSTTFLRAHRGERRPEVVDVHPLTINGHAQVSRVGDAQPVPVKQSRRATDVKT